MFTWCPGKWMRESWSWERFQLVRFRYTARCCWTICSSSASLSGLTPSGKTRYDSNGLWAGGWSKWCVSGAVMVEWGWISEACERTKLDMCCGRRCARWCTHDDSEECLSWLVASSVVSTWVVCVSSWLNSCSNTMHGSASLPTAPATTPEAFRISMRWTKYIYYLPTSPLVAARNPLFSHSFCSCNSSSLASDARFRWACFFCFRLFFWYSLNFLNGKSRPLQQQAHAEQQTDNTGNQYGAVIPHTTQAAMHAMHITTKIMITRQYMRISSQQEASM